MVTDHSDSSVLVANGDVELFVRSLTPEVGEGPPILLLSEAEAASTRWPSEFLEGLLGLGCEVIIFDTRDVGRSTWVEETFGIDDLVSDALAVLDHLDLTTAHVFGRSMGGIVAQHLALDAPERVASLSLLSTTPGRREDIGLPEQWLIDNMTHRLFGEQPLGTAQRVEWVVDQLEWFAGPLVPFDRVDAARAVWREVAEYWRGPNGHGTAVVEAVDRFDELALITVPAMVVHGTVDPVYPVAHGQALAERLPNATLFLIEGLGHELPPHFVSPLVELFAQFRGSLPA